MLFNTFEFWLFFLVFLLVHAVAHRAQNLLLLAASYFFYGCWDWRFLSLLFLSTAVDYLAAHVAAPGRRDAVRRIAVALSLTVNLGALAVFKYYDFFVESLASVLALPDGAADDLLLRAILPVGISFYTFQSLGYTIDVYRGRTKPERSFLDFALYVSFFPQLVAGPIERAESLLPQIREPRKITGPALESGAFLIAWGLFKKVVIADALAHPVNAVYADPGAIGPEIYVATVAFAFQILCDFSGYTDIARGVARWLGFELRLNFDRPYLSRNPSEFWRRWHMSLSSWLRDYLYIPLGGNRAGEPRTSIHLMVTMALGGLWHGARMNFLLWGLYQGLGLLVHRRFRSPESAPAPLSFAPGQLLRMALMFQFTLFGWLLFRVETWDQLTRMTGALTRSWGTWNGASAIAGYMAPLVVPLLLVWIVRTRVEPGTERRAVPWPLRAAGLGVMVAFVLLLNRGEATPFLYFQF